VGQERDELHFVHLVDQAVVDLADHQCFCHHDQVLLHFQLDDAVHCDYGDFLT
jgi:hypothetical protein